MQTIQDQIWALHKSKWWWSSRFKQNEAENTLGYRQFSSNISREMMYIHYNSIKPFSGSCLSCSRLCKLMYFVCLAPAICGKSCDPVHPLVMQHDATSIGNPLSLTPLGMLLKLDWSVQQYAHYQLEKSVKFTVQKEKKKNKLPIFLSEKWQFFWENNNSVQGGLLLFLQSHPQKHAKARWVG